jgi:hypothetical protein
VGDVTGTLAVRAIVTVEACQASTATTWAQHVINVVAIISGGFFRGNNAIAVTILAKIASQSRKTTTRTMRAVNLIDFD